MSDIKIEKVLGKIAAAQFGFGGYQDCQFGLSVAIRGPWGGVSDFWGFWGEDPGRGAQWSMEQQTEQFGLMTRRVVELLRAAKVKHVSSLEGIPVEVVFRNGTELQSWRVLEEVL